MCTYLTSIAESELNDPFPISPQEASETRGTSGGEATADECYACILAIGIGGGAMQAILNELSRLKLPVSVRAISSVSPQLVPGDDAAEAFIAADITWGTRIATR